MQRIRDDMATITYAMAAGYVPGASPYACELSDALRGREVASARAFLEREKESIKREEMKMANDTTEFNDVARMVGDATAATDGQRLIAQMQELAKRLDGVRVEAYQFKQRLAGVHTPTMPTTACAPVEPGVSHSDVGLLGAISREMKGVMGDIAKLEDLLKELRKIV